MYTLYTRADDACVDGLGPESSPRNGRLCAHRKYITLYRHISGSICVACNYAIVLYTHYIR